MVYSVLCMGNWVNTKPIEEQNLGGIRVFRVVYGEAIHYTPYTINFN